MSNVKRRNQYLDKKLVAHLKLDWYNEQAVKSEARRQANQPVRTKTSRQAERWAARLLRTPRTHDVVAPMLILVCDVRTIHDAPALSARLCRPRSPYYYSCTFVSYRGPTWAYRDNGTGAFLKHTTVYVTCKGGLFFCLRLSAIN